MFGLGLVQLSCSSAQIRSSQLNQNRRPTAAVHVALQVQKNNQSKSHNKGLTFLVFDENKAKADALADLLWDVPNWTDDYYQKKKKQERLDQSPFADETTAMLSVSQNNHVPPAIRDAFFCHCEE